jgi:hypothetical protein
MRGAGASFLLWAAMIADAGLHSADAQCAANDQIFIDPRLAPSRPRITAEQMQAMMLNRLASPAQKQEYMNMYLAQNQPIQVPFRDGIVLVHPQNPCIQQYLGK